MLALRGMILAHMILRAILRHEETAGQGSRTRAHGDSWLKLKWSSGNWFHFFSSQVCAMNKKLFNHSRAIDKNLPNHLHVMYSELLNRKAKIMA